MPYRIGVDIGGTFTDLSLLDEGSERIVATHKLPSRPADPIGAVADGVAALLGSTAPGEVRTLLHGSTVGLNALLAESEPPPALLTTAGFRDVYELGRQWRGERVYDLFLEGPRMLLPRWQILEVPERVGARGEIVRPLDEAAADALVERVLALGVQSVAIALLFAFANPAHEQLLGRLFRERAPELHVSLSSEVSPEFREYERTATTVANAYIGPRMAQYVARFERVLREVLPAARVLIMQSNGGTATAGAVVRVPIRTLMSGPVAGVVASKYLGDQVGMRDLLTIDVGGTSCDMAVLPGELSYTTQSSVGGHVIRTPSVDIHTIGSGGGSIAWLGPGGVLKVGPRSAGAEPGPACYGRGGRQPTLTDALLVLGYLGERSFLGGRMAIQAAPAAAAIATHVAEPLGLSVPRAAAGIVRVLSNQVALAMRSITVERGHDPREFTLVAFGGAGPTLAAHLARELGIPRVLVPREPGNFCAFGMLVSDLRHDVVRTRIGRLDDLPDAEILGHFDALCGECARELAAQGAPGEIVLERYCDMRYVGQSYEVLVPVAGAAGALDRAALQADFHRLHERRYGHKAPGEPVEVVAFRVRGIGLSAKPAATPEPHQAGAAPAAADERAVLFDADTDALPTPVYRRDGLRAGQRLAGPCIVEERSSTTVVVPGADLIVDGYGNLVLTLAADEPAGEGGDGQG